MVIWCKTALNGLGVTLFPRLISVFIPMNPSKKVQKSEAYIETNKWWMKWLLFYDSVKIIAQNLNSFMILIWQLKIYLWTTIILIRTHGYIINVRQLLWCKTKNDSTNSFINRSYYYFSGRFGFRQNSRLKFRHF